MVMPTRWESSVRLIFRRASITSMLNTIMSAPPLKCQVVVLPQGGGVGHQPGQDIEHDARCRQKNVTSGVIRRVRGALPAPR